MQVTGLLLQLLVEAVEKYFITNTLYYYLLLLLCITFMKRGVAKKRNCCFVFRQGPTFLFLSVV